MADRLTISKLISSLGYQVPESYSNPRYRSIGGTPRADVAGAAEEANVDPRLLGNVIGTESEYRNLLANRAGARGVAQFVPTTGRQFGVTDLMNPRQSVYGAGRALDAYMRDFGSPDLALSAYNRGVGATNRYLAGRDIRGNLYDREADPTGELNAGNFTRLPNQTQNYIWNNLRGTDAFGSRGMLPGLDRTHDLSGAVNGAFPGRDWDGDLGDFDLRGQSPGGLYSPRGTDMRLSRFGDAEARGTAPNWTLPGMAGRVLNFGDDQESGTSSLRNIATGMPDWQRAPGPRTDYEFYPTTRFGPNNRPGGQGDPFTGPSINQRAAGAFDLTGMPFEDRWGGLSPSFEDRWGGDRSRPMEMVPGQRQTPETWPSLDRLFDEESNPYRGPAFDPGQTIGSRYAFMRSGPGSTTDAGGPGDVRTDFERSGGIAGLTRGAGNWLYDRSAEAAGRVVGGMGDLADWAGGLPDRFRGSAVTLGAGDFAGRFGAATPGWGAQDNTPTGRDDFIQDATGGNFPFSRGLNLGTGGGLERFNFTAGGGFTPGRLGTEDPGNGQPWPGASFDERFPSGGPSFTDRLSGLNRSGGGMMDFAGFRPGGQFPSPSRPGLDPVPSTPSLDADHWMPDWRSSGSFPSSGFPRGGMADFRSFTPGGNFSDNFAGRFPTGSSSPTNTFDSRFDFSTRTPSTSGGGFSAASRLGLPSYGGDDDSSSIFNRNTLGGNYNPGANWQGPGGQGSIYDRAAAIRGGGTGFQSPTLTRGGGVTQNRIPAPPPLRTYGVMQLANAAHNNYERNYTTVMNPNTYVSPYGGAPIPTGGVMSDWQRVAPGGGPLPNLTPGNHWSYG